MSGAESVPSPEDQDLGLNSFNEEVELLNRRKRNAAYMKFQAFTFTTAQQSYTIGASADFDVDSGVAPSRIEAAQLVQVADSPDSMIQLAVYNWQEYSRISMPALTATGPRAIYYEQKSANGVIYPYPAFPSTTSNQLRLWWPVQLATVALADIATEFTDLTPGAAGAIASKLAVRMWPMFAKKSDLAQLKAQARQDWSDFTAPNTSPPRISTTDGIQPSGGFSWRSRTWV